MQRARLIVTDISGEKGTITVPFKDASTVANKNVLFNQILNVISPVIDESCLETGLQFGNALGVTGPSPSVTQLAVISFTSTPGPGLSVPLLGPQNIYKSDGYTVDPTLTGVANVIASLLAYATDGQGHPLVAYNEGRRLG
jgi:hypothetical protein